MKVKPIPDDRPRITPYLIVPGVAMLIDFLQAVFDAEELHRSVLPNGRIAHAEIRIGDGRVMMGEPTEGMAPMPASIYIYVEDADAAYKRALDAGATSLMEPADQFHGDRYGGVEDAHGNKWWLVTHVEDVAPDEIARREREYVKQKGA